MTDLFEKGNPFAGMDLISVYTWDNAVADGTFVEVTGLAKKWGFKIPVAITRNLYSTHLKQLWPDGTENEHATNKMIALLLVELHQAIKEHKEPNNMITFDANLKDGGVTVWASIEGRSPSTSEPAMTILLPEDY